MKYLQSKLLCKYLLKYDYDNLLCKYFIQYFTLYFININTSTYINL